MFSIDFLLWLQALENPVISAIMQGITLIGSEKLYIVFVAWIYWCKDTKQGEKWANMILTSAIVNSSMKLMVDAPRPFEVSTQIKPLAEATATGSSFPSGHSQASANFGTFIALNFKSPLVKLLGILLFLLVGISRLYLRVHFPGDVLVGWLLGIALAGIFFAFYDKAPKAFVVLMFIIMLIGWYHGPDEDLIKLTGLAVSSTLGFWINRKFLRLDVHPFKEGGRRKLGFGVICLLGCLYGLKMLMPEYLDILRYGIVGLVMTVLYPLAFELVIESASSKQSNG